MKPTGTIKQSATNKRVIDYEGYSIVVGIIVAIIGIVTLGLIGMLGINI